MANIQKTEVFLRQSFAGCSYFKEHPADGEYRLQHSYRVANAAREIARREKLDVEGLTIGGLLHDLGYSILGPEDNWIEHGRVSARLARPFLEQLNLTTGQVDEICYGIAIHVDGKADFYGEETPFALSIGEADDIDRFDAFRIYETLFYENFRELKIEEKRRWLEKKLDWIHGKLRGRFGTETARQMITERLLYQEQYYKRVLCQMEHSESLV